MKHSVRTVLHFIRISGVCLFAFLLFPAAAQDGISQRDAFLKKTEDSIRRKIARIADAMDITADSRIREAIETEIRLRTAKAAAAGKYVQEHFAGKVVIPLCFNCPDDPAGEEELLAFLSNAPDVKLAGPVYLSSAPDQVLPLPDEAPDAGALNAALLRCIELHADLIVNFAGLPALRADRDRLIFWKWGQNDPRLILLDLSDTLALKENLFPCPLAAAVVPVPFPEEAAEPKETEADGEDPDAALRSRFLLLTPENLKDLLQRRKVFFSAKGSASSMIGEIAK